MLANSQWTDALSHPSDEGDCSSAIVKVRAAHTMYCADIVGLLV